MEDLKNISKIFLLKSKALTISCISSIFIAVVLIISMLNLSTNAELSYKNKLRMAYGDCDAIVTYSGYAEIPKDTIEQIKGLKGLDKFSAGYFDSDFMIEDNSVYLVGSDNSDMMKKRYHYKNDLRQGEIAVNSILANCLRCKPMDIITIDGMNYRICEIFEDNTGSSAGITMAIMNLDSLTQLLGKSPGNNFILFSVVNHTILNDIMNDIGSLDVQLDINAVETDELYKSSIKSFAIVINALMICVVIVTGLFVTSIMRRFIYKYNHDLAIIRAIGGRQKQVKCIFRHIIIYINFVGCMGGFLASIVLNKFLLSFINQKVQLIEGDIRFNFLQSLLIAAISFLILVFILMVSIRSSFKILPLEAFMQNELNQIGKGMKRNKKSNIFWVSKLLGKDTYITLKLLSDRFKENLFITCTIMMIVIISFLGGGLRNIIQKNNNTYLKQQFISDTVVTSSNIILYKDFAKYYKILQDTDGISASIVLDAVIEASYKEEPISFLIADLNAMEQQGILKNIGAEEDRIILSVNTAAKYGISVGDFINVLTPFRYSFDSNGKMLKILEEPHEVRMHVAAVLPDSTLQYRNAYIDIKCYDFMQEYCPLNCIYVNGNQNIAEQLLNQIKNINTGVKWENYKDVVKISNKAITQRYIMFEIIVGILALIAGLGWFNAIRYTIVSRNDEYSILRIHGMTSRRLRKMLFIHIFIYLSIGIISGIVVGISVLAFITYLESGTSIITFNFRSLGIITLYMILLSMLLISDIFKVSKTKIITNE